MLHGHSDGSNTLHSKEIDITHWGSERETVESHQGILQPAESKWVTQYIFEKSEEVKSLVDDAHLCIVLQRVMKNPKDILSLTWR